MDFSNALYCTRYVLNLGYAKFWIWWEWKPKSKPHERCLVAHPLFLASGGGA
jgi:hypothetical protein